MHLSLREIQRRTGISRPSLIKYAKVYAAQLFKHTAWNARRQRIYDERTIPMFQLFREAGIRKRGNRS